MIDITKAVNEAIRIANDKAHGYSQINRYGPDYDCSSFVCYVLRFGGADIPPNLTTHNMKEQLLKIGYKTTSLMVPRKKGDIFLNVNNHVVICIDSENVANASLSENGTIDGKTGDQKQTTPNGQTDTTGEIRIQKFYNYSKGWDYHFTLDDVKPTGNIWKIAKDTYNGKYGNGQDRKNALGSLYDDVQKIVNLICKYGGY